MHLLKTTMEVKTVELSKEPIKNIEGLTVIPDMIVDEHIVTAQPTGYVEFAITLGQLMDIYKDEEDFNETVDFFMNFKIQE